MRYLFITGHPAHVHLFKNVIRALSAKGHEVIVGAVAREVTTGLLDAYDMRYFTFGESKPDLPSKAVDLFRKDLSLLRFAHDYDPDVLVSTGSPYAAHISAIISRPHLVFGDTEHAKLIARLTIPFSDAVCTPACYEGDLGPKQFRYNGYKELAYLDPRYYTPDPRSLDGLGLSSDEPYIIVRFAAWDASHDIGDQGFNFHGSGEIISFLSEIESYARVVVTADTRPGPPLDAYTVSVPPERMHDVLAFARLYIGEGATMAAEAGVLGIPWIFVSSQGRGFLNDQEKNYGLGRWVRTLPDARRLLPDLVRPSVRADWEEKRRRMLSDKEDVVAFITRFIEAWPAKGRGRRGISA